MPVAIHTIGDLSLEYVIDVLELYPPAEGLRDRIIHCQLAREELIERMKTYKPLLIYNQSLFHRIFHQSLKNWASNVFVMPTLGRRYWRQDYTVTGIRCSD